MSYANRTTWLYYLYLQLFMVGGEGGIRTRGSLPHQRFRPDPKLSNHQIHSKPEYQVQNRYSQNRFKLPSC
jgi:hypothetical protein